MDDRDFNPLPQGGDKLWPGEDAPSPTAAQPPLTDRETAGLYKAVQGEREQRQALEKQLAELKNPTEPASINLIQRDFELAAYANNLKISRRFAEREYGREVVSAVHDWAVARCDADPAFNALMRESDDPYEAAKRSFDQDQASPPDNRIQSHFSLPRSLVDAPGNGAVGKTHVPVGDGNAYDSLFK